LIRFIGIPIAAGKLKKIDSTKALKIPGVVAVYDQRDFPINRWGTIVRDQPILVENEIGYADEPICIIVGETREALRAAKNALVIEVDEAKPVLAIEKAIDKKMFLYQSKGLSRGNAAEALAKSPHKISGHFDIGGQEHFYLESQAAIAYPLENDQIEIHSSSQHPTEVQHVCAEALNLKHHQVTCIVKRMGGGFGGKESQASPFAAMAALVAHKLKRPARLALDKDDDMKMTGKRHPFKNFYEIGFDNSGRVLAAKLQFYSNGGAYTDLSPSVLERAVFHSDGCYFIENIEVRAAVCKTNTHSNTAFRGFGGPQGNMTMEMALEEIAIFLKKDPMEIRKINLYGKDSKNITHYGQKVEFNTLPDLFDKIYESSDYKNRRQELESWNQKHNGTLRGLSVSGCKFGIAFNTRFLNQANALVNVHRDGTIQVSTGATEMGQGVNTKIGQLVANTFGIPVSYVQMMATSTEKNHNTSATAASSGTDLNGAAALVACNKIKNRLIWVASYLEKNPVPPVDFPEPETTIDFRSYEFAKEKITNKKTGFCISWIDLLNKTFHGRISLGDYGFFRTEGLDFDDQTRKGNAFKYFTSGAAVSEVEIDEFTGETKVRRVDLLMDIGRPINPGVDMGQVVGGFVQGMGWMLTESLWHNEKGQLVSHSPTTYKIPNIQDTPRIFNADFLSNIREGGSVFSSKAVGEPPLLLGTSVLLAVKNALSYRTSKIPPLRCPATPEEILMRLTKCRQKELQ
ncbi:MAG: xanthine dehydrogenase molybdopterin binding subunit, partial [Pseudobdellovibrionaceae bacterium]